MQVNEHVGQVQQGTQLPDKDRAFNESRRTGTKRSERIEQNLDSREAVTRTTRKPRLFGAGF